MPDPELVYVCEICQTLLHAHHCKATCPNCGRMFDCSDLPFMSANAIFTEENGITLRPGSDPRDWMPSVQPPPNERPHDENDSVKDLP